MHTISQFSESLLSNDGPSASKQFVSMRTNYQLVNRNSSLDSNGTDCETLLADPITYSNSLTQALSYEDTGISSTGIIDVFVLYVPERLAVQSQNTELWYLRSDGIYLKDSTRKFLFADYGISGTPIRGFETGSLSFVIAFDDGINWKFSYNYWTKEWNFSKCIPNNLPLSKHFGVTKQSDLSASEHSNGTVTFNCEFERLSEAAVSVSTIDFEYEDKSEYESKTANFWLELIDIVNYASAEMFPSNPNNIDTEKMKGDVSSFLERYNMMEAISGFKDYYFQEYPINETPYFKDVWETNRDYQDDLDIFEYERVFVPHLNASNGDLDAFVCWLIPFPIFGRPKSNNKIDFKQSDRDPYADRRNLVASAMASLRDGTQGSSASSSHLSEIFDSDFANYVGSKEMHAPFATETITYYLLEDESKPLNEFEEFTAAGVKVSYSWILSGGQYSKRSKEVAFPKSKGRAGWFSVDQSDMPENVEGLIVWQSIFMNGQWQQWQQSGRFDFAQIDDTPNYYTTDVSYYRDKDNTDEEHDSFQDTVINSAIDGSVYFMPVVCEESDSVSFQNLAGYVGDIMVGWKHYLNAGGFHVVAGVNSGDFSSDEHLFTSAISQDGFTQEDIYPELTIHEIPQLAGATIYKLLKIDRYLYVVTSDLISIFAIQNERVNHVRTVYGASPVNDKSFTTDGRYLYVLTNEGIKMVDAGGNKQLVFDTIAWENLSNPFMYFDKGYNEIVIHGDGLCYVANLKQGSIYQRAYDGGNPVEVFFIEGIATITDGTSMFEYKKGRAGDTAMLTRPQHFDMPQVLKRLKDVYLTLTIDDTINSETEVLTLYVKSQKADRVFEQTLTISDYEKGVPLTVRMRVHRIAQVEVPTSTAEWSMTELDGGQAYWELSVDGKTSPARWFQFGINVPEGLSALIKIDSIDIGFTSIGAR